ncbi:DNA polymerase III subunit delta' [Gallaecimonas sp. GXIMD4217]|uniref:DNA polymerase III subunit delta' n=1 Tax=Gallaecimonas sp. GXIMD4217 TaxID=3131927 RepID=UPI00311B2BC5
MLPWLQSWLDRFGHWQAQGRLAHAYLLSGPRGLGKAQLAEAMAARFLCKAPQGPCGHCHPCQLLAAGTHPDLHQLAPDGSQIKVDAVRALLGPVYERAQLGGAKVVIITQAEAMNVNAANALLKSLEEPPRDTHWLLLCRSPGRLLPTILSRCQQLTLGVPTEAEALAWLADQGVKATPALLRRFHGAPLALRQALADGYGEQTARLQQDLAELETGRLLPEQFAGHWHKEAEFCLEELAHRLLDQMRLRSGLPLLYHDRLDRRESLSGQGLKAAWQAVLGCRQALIEQPALNKKLLLLDLAALLQSGRSETLAG